MSTQSSEQLLKALEQSEDDATSLIAQAAAIAGVVFNEQNGNFENPSRTSQRLSSAFREQWLLKWLIKRLTRASQKDRKASRHNVQQFLSHQQTWSLLSYLLSVIPEQTVNELLIERSFAKVLMDSSRLLLQGQQAPTTTQPVELYEGQDETGPRKRLRLSSEPENVTLHRAQQTSKASKLTLLQFLGVLGAWSQLLRPDQEILPLAPRTITPAWAESIHNAAEFLDSVLRCVREAVVTGFEQESIVALDANITRWLRLWHGFATSDNVADKSTICKTFNDQCLTSALNLYDVLKEFEQPHLTSAMKEIERQIALYTVLPLRSAFNEKHATSRKGSRDAVTWQQLEPVCKTFQTVLGSALHDETILGHQKVSFPNPKWAAYLVSIASRIIPKEDVRQRQSELPWLENLVLCLAHLAFPQEMPRMYAGSDDTLQLDQNILPPSFDATKHWPDDLLATIATEDIQLSTPSKQYFIASLLSWRARPLSIPLLSAVTNVDSALFVPSTGGPNSTFCLDGLLSAMTEVQTLTRAEYETAIETIMHPIMDAFAKARDFKGLLDMWLPNLEEALRVRTRVAFGSDNVPASLVWDDMDVFARFSELCRLDRPTFSAEHLLDDVVRGMSTITERIGPTTDIFSRLSVLESTLKANGEATVPLTRYVDTLTVLQELIADMLKVQSDYQGQRWRLWSMLIVLTKLGVSIDVSDSLKDTLKKACKQCKSMTASIVDEMQQSQRNAALMEQFMVFSFLVELFTTGPAQLAAKKRPVWKSFKKLIENLTRMIDESHRSSPTIDPVRDEQRLWDGRINSLHGINQLIDGQLAYLLQKPDLFDPEHSVGLDLLSVLRGPLTNHKQATSKETLVECIMAFLFRRYSHSTVPETPTNAQKQSVVNSAERNAISIVESEQSDAMDADQIPHGEIAINDLNAAQKLDLVRSLFQADDPAVETTHATLALTILERVEIQDLKALPMLARVLASKVPIQETSAGLGLSELAAQLDVSMLILELQPGVVNQATLDACLKGLVYATSAALRIRHDPKSKSQIKLTAMSIFDRIVETIGLLLAKYRRRMTGRTHLLLPILQNLLKCFFYTPSRAYIHQNAATAKQRQALRSSFPHWLEGDLLPVSSAKGYARLLLSICNPSIVSARSAHRNRHGAAAGALELNDETKKAKIIAGQYMQYLVSEYTRCSLDGVIQPEVRQKLMPGIYSTLDAISSSSGLMEAMNSSMDPSSRAIFKGLYSDWKRFWKWDQN